MIDPRQPIYAETPVAPTRPRFAYAPVVSDEPAYRRPPAATIVTPFHNAPDVFEETAQCVLGQSLQNLEWLIVNDGSTRASSLEMLRAYRPGGGKHDSRIRVVDHRVNRGLPAARNTGFRLARSEFVFQLDADDLIEATTVEKCLWHLHSYPEFSFSHGYTVGFGGQEYLWERGFHDDDKFLIENFVTATGMVRRSVHAAIGGYDESIRGGMEDWEFWLRAASRGFWGATIPEHLDWYRRREAQHDDWENLRSREAGLRFRRMMAARFPLLYEGVNPELFDLNATPETVVGARNFPFVRPRWQMPFGSFPNATPFANPLTKRAPRLLIVVPWLRLGGADRFNMDLLKFLAERLPALVNERTAQAREIGSTPDFGSARGVPRQWLSQWEVTIVTTAAGHPWLPEFTRHTPDVFCLSHICHPSQYPLALRHLCESRRPDVVVVSNSDLGYHCLPYMRAHHSEAVYLDFNHMEEEHWKSGGHPRTGAGFQDMLDVSGVVSGHLKRWMASRGAREERIEVCHINADSSRWKPDADARAWWRAHLEIGSDVPLVLYAARLCAQKQPHVFAKTMRLVVDADPRVLAVVAGDGELQGDLERQLDALGLRDNVRMLGAVPAEEMPRAMAASDIFFLPSQWEGIALSIYEAMSAGLAVLGADVGGQTELVTPETGVLLKRPSPEDFDLEASRYAKELLALVHDPARREALGHAARKRIIEHFELDSMGLRMLGMFEKARQWKQSEPRVAIGERLAKELALQGVENIRIHDLADYLWARQAPSGAQSAEQAAAEAARVRAQIERELVELEGSRAWQLVVKLKQVPPYPLLARLRYGSSWNEQAPADPGQRLHHIRSSRAYKVITRVKSTVPYRLYRGR